MKSRLAAASAPNSHACDSQVTNQPEEGHMAQEDGGRRGDSLAMVICVSQVCKGLIMAFLMCNKLFGTPYKMRHTTRRQCMYSQCYSRVTM